MKKMATLLTAVILVGAIITGCDGQQPNPNQEPRTENPPDLGMIERGQPQDSGSREERYILGDPADSLISKETAIASAVQLLTEKYELSQETIDRFTVTAEFYARYEGAPVPVWWVRLDPIDRYDFTEIGAYWALIDSDTGEAVGLFSALDGDGRGGESDVAPNIPNYEQQLTEQQLIEQRRREAAAQQNNPNRPLPPRNPDGTLG